MPIIPMILQVSLVWFIKVFIPIMLQDSKIKESGVWFIKVFIPIVLQDSVVWFKKFNFINILAITTYYI